jgi:PKD repeat protein
VVVKESGGVKRESLRFFFVVITTVILLGLLTVQTKACIDAKFSWDPYTYPPVFSVGDTVTFNASLCSLNWNDTSQEYIPIIEYKWDFGDGTITEGEIVTHSYTETGNYNVNLTITDMGGAKDSFMVPFEVKQPSPFNWGPLSYVALALVAASIGVGVPIYFLKVKKRG